VPPPQSPKSRKRQSIPAHPAAAACASSRSSLLGNSGSTARPHFRRRSGSTPHDDNLRAIAPECRSAVCPLLSRPRLSSRPYCLHLETAAPVCTDTPPRASEEARRPHLHCHPHRSTDPRGRCRPWFKKLQPRRSPFDDDRFRFVKPFVIPKEPFVVKPRRRKFPLGQRNGAQFEDAHFDLDGTQMTARYERPHTHSTGCNGLKVCLWLKAAELSDATCRQQSGYTGRQRRRQGSR
jgi:hypothetical protein